jgi:head-tail adaptor
VASARVTDGREKFASQRESHDADAIIRVDYQTGPAIRIDEIAVKLKRMVVTGIAVKLSCAA